MKVLLTGGGGMVGRNIQIHPEASAHEIVAPRRTEVDLTDYSAVLAKVREVSPDIIIHTAGRVGGIQANMADPVGFLVENMAMGQNIVLAAAEHGVPRLINLGSSCMFPRAAENPLTEDMVLTGELEPTNEGYALSKIVTDRLCRYISSTQTSLSYKTLIPCNLYGFHDKFDPKVSHLVPSIIRKVHDAVVNGSPTVEIWGDGTARREFMFSLDLADAIWAGAGRFEDLPDTMNVGIGSDHTINEYYQVVAEVLGWKGEFVHDLTKPVGMKQKLVSIERQSAFGWQPRVSLADGIAQTYAHFKENHL